MKVLLVDDDLELLDVTSYALKRSGYQVIPASDGAQALRRWEEDQPDIVVLDRNLPKMGGLEVCQEIRRRGTTPIILLTAMFQDDHIIEGLRAGADDYITKPFSTRVLAARIQAVWRRSVGARTHREPPKELTIGPLSVDVDSHEVQLTDGSIVRLTPIEYRILHTLAAYEGRVVSSASLVDHAWGIDGGDTSLLKTHISHIRRKLNLGPGCDIMAVPRVGYRLVRQAASNGHDRKSEQGSPIALAG